MIESKKSLECKKDLIWKATIVSQGRAVEESVVWTSSLLGGWSLEVPYDP